MELETEGTLFNSVYEASIAQIPAQDKKYYKERKLQINISHKKEDIKILHNILINQIQPCTKNVYIMIYPRYARLD